MTGTYAASFLPWILIPVVMWLLPVVTMAIMFLYIEQEG
ncbi:MAG: photosystem I reaction center subunit VIII [Pseudanabaenaceae cyanobacterium SKYGB_i_bin29]|nr:photosystem I reaction center subunit VIII [Pseudanabaenaceae cyanobacterium SKYG29]MDW8421977.1 photosystem I reaction center subunit VIII [Pseudanabaenaceae cyanobacterium SKYGB_i_bin29]